MKVKNISQLKVINYFCYKIHILDAWQGPKRVSGRRMKISRYQSLPFVNDHSVSLVSLFVRSIAT